MNDKKTGCIGIVLFLLLCGSLFGNLLLFTMLAGKVASPTSSMGSSGGRQFAELQVEAGSSDNKIVHIDLKGMITATGGGVMTDSMVGDIKLALRQAQKDDSVKAIVLQIDSPGGEVTASDILYNAIEKADSDKPVIVYMNSIAASGGYYAACGARHLMANPTTITGSIGVIIQTLNYEDLFEKVGLDAIVFKSGKFKDILSGSREMTAAEQKYVQDLVMQTYGRFVGIVADTRELPVEALKQDVADGRIFTGQDALEEDLIDGVGYIEDAYAEAREIIGDPDARIVRYSIPISLGNILRLLGESRGGIDINLIDSPTTELESGRLYYLPSIYAH